MRSPLYYASLEDIADRLQYITEECSKHDVCFCNNKERCPYWNSYTGCNEVCLFYGISPSNYDRHCCEEIARRLLHEDDKS